MKTIYVTKMPKCDTHPLISDDPPPDGIYNTPTKKSSPGRGSWGNLCPDCMIAFGIDTSVTEKRVYRPDGSVGT